MSANTMQGESEQTKDTDPCKYGQTRIKDPCKCKSVSLSTLHNRSRSYLAWHRRAGLRTTKAESQAGHGGSSTCTVDTADPAELQHAQGRIIPCIESYV
eukprot:354654-Chlamydomonas_euryale.AAC.3